MSEMHFTVAVRSANNTYEARVRPCINASTAHLEGRKATCTAGEEQAISRLLNCATPPLRLHQVKQIRRGDTPAGPHLYEVVAMVDRDSKIGG